MTFLAIIVSLFLSTKFLSVENEELKNYLTRISENFLYQNVSSIKERSSPEDIAEVGGEGAIFFVYDQNKKPIAVIKKYALEDPSYKDEYKTLVELNAMSFQEFHPVRLLGISEDRVDGEEMGVLILDVAKGKSLNHYLQEISKTKKHTKRERLLMQLERGMEKAAMGLAEFHKKGYTHGDTHLGNIFYDTETDAAYFIDFSTTQTNKRSAKDIAQILLATEVLGSYYNLSGTEITHLRGAFLKTYRALNPDISDDRIARYRHDILLSYTACGRTEDSTAQATYLYNYCKRELAGTLNNHTHHSSI